MFKANYDEDSKCVVIEKDGVSLTLTEPEFRFAVEDVNKQLYYRQDIEEFLDNMLESGDLEEDIAKDPEFVNDLLEEYIKARETGDWETCMECAFDQLSLDDYGICGQHRES